MLHGDASLIHGPPASPTGSAPHRLIVISNRLPFVAEPSPDGPRFTRAPGGLVSALEAVLARRGGTWIGWPGVPAEDGAATAPPLPDGPPGVSYRPVPLSPREVAQYYEGFCNSTLWPLFHYFVSRTQIDASTWGAYDRVNERLAEAAATDARTADLVWVHDYQLLRVPHHLRRLAPAARIGFFLHIPFPATDVFRVLPWSRQLLRGLLAADLVAFHVGTYVDHFLLCAERLLGCEVDRNAGVVQFDGRQVAVQAHPISIDVASVERLAAAAPRRSPDGAVAEIIGVDRLDYTKGIHERLHAIERLLETHPGYRQRLRFTQVLVPSRERVSDYEQLKREIDQAVGRINGRFSESGWTPIHYLVRSLPPEELVPLYRLADVALVTPLRDGMNLVAKEYVAAQLDNDGVLILSEMAGAAEELQEALLVNPFDVEAVADALAAALAMPPDERRARMSILRDRVRSNDVHAWVDRFLTAADVASGAARASVLSPAERIQRALTRWLGDRQAVALFLDYDGTLTPLVDDPATAVLAEDARQLLRQASATPRLDVTIVSGRALSDLSTLVNVPGLTYVGNHGFEIEGPGVSFRHEKLDRFRRALDEAATDLRALAVPGARVEHKGCTLSFHLRGVERVSADAARDRASSILRRRHLRATLGNAVVEGRPTVDWHKGHAVLYVLRQRHGADWPARTRALYIGDDMTDEDAFRSLRGIGRSIWVGPGQSEWADFRLPDPDAVLRLLRWLASGAFADPAV